MKSTTVGHEVVKEGVCGDVAVKSHMISEVLVPNFVNDGADEECSTALAVR
jgi:hypothetical protein